MAIKQIFTADIKDLEKGMAKIEQQNTKLLEQNKKMQNASKQAGKASERSAKQQETGLNKVFVSAAKVATALAGPAGIVAAVHVVKKAYGEWIIQIDKAAEHSTKFHATLTKNLSEAGDLLYAAKLEKFFESVPGANREDVEKAYAGVAGAVPGMARSRRMDIAAEAAKLGPTGQDVGQIGAMAGEFGEVFATKTADDLVDLALKMRQMAGKNISQLTGRKFLKGIKDLQEAGVMEPERAFAMGLTAADKDISPGVLPKISQVVTGHYEPKTAAKGKTLAEDEEQYNRFVGAGAGDRWKMLQKSDELQKRFMTEQAVGFGRLLASQSEVEKAMDELQRAQTGNAARSEVAAMAKASATHAKVLEYNRDAAVEKTPEAKWEEYLGEQHGRYMAELTRQRKGKGMFGGAAHRMGATIGEYVPFPTPGMTPWESALATGGNLEPKWHTQELNVRRQLFEERPDVVEMLKGRGILEPAPKGVFGVGTGEEVKTESLAAQKELIAVIKAQTAALLKQPANPAAVQANLHQHEETGAL